MRTLVLKAPAKLNIDLRIVGRRSDGYHFIQSVMVPIDLCDEVTITARFRDDFGITPPTIVCEMMWDASVQEARRSPMPADEKNLAVRAAHLWMNACGEHQVAHVTIAIKKSIPMGAGLGGGSSNAAAVLKGLAEITGLEAYTSRLHTHALQLGADVPFFLDTKPSIVSGIGEVLQPIACESGIDNKYILFIPPFGMDTAEAYALWDHHYGDHFSQPQIIDGSSTLGHTIRSARNDLERAVFQKHASLRAVFDRLKSTSASLVRMTGSGSTLFALMARGTTPEDFLQNLGVDFAEKLHRDNWVILKVKGMESTT